MDELKGKVAWVTGGSRGIGKAIATVYAKNGMNVAISYVSNEKAASETTKILESFGVEAIAVKTDVSSHKSVQEAHDRISKDLGTVEVLVNSAGVIRDNLFIMLKDEDWDNVIGTNLLGSVWTCKEVIRGMMGKRWGRIINLSSVAATRGGKGQANYAASKGAIEAMTRSLAAEIGRRGITVNCIAPGVIETEMSEEVIKLGKDEIMERQILKRFGSADEIAAWALMLTCDKGGFMTGQVLHVDGGLKMA